MTLTRDQVMEKVREHLAAEFELDAAEIATRPASRRISTPTRSTSTSS